MPDTMTTTPTESKDWDCVLDESTFLDLINRTGQVGEFLASNELVWPTVAVDSVSGTTLSFFEWLADRNIGLDEFSRACVAEYLNSCLMLANPVPRTNELVAVIRHGALVATRLRRLMSYADEETAAICDDLKMSLDTVFTGIRAFTLDVPIVTFEPARYPLWEKLGVRVLEVAPA